MKNIEKIIMHDIAVMNFSTIVIIASLLAIYTFYKVSDKIIDRKYKKRRLKAKRKMIREKYNMPNAA